MPHKPLSQSALKKFRSALSILKKKGIVSNIDVRSAQPWMIRQGHKLGDQVKKFDDVISNKAEAVKLPQAKLRAYKKAGYETTQGRVLVPKPANDQVTVERGEIKITDKKSGLEVIKKAVPYHNLQQWLEDFGKQTSRLNMMKRRNEWFGYTIGAKGPSPGYSHVVYRSMQKLYDDLVNGSVSGLNLMDKVRHDSYKNQNEFFKEFEIVRIPNADRWPGLHKSLAPKRGKPMTNKQRRAWEKRTRHTPKGEERARKHAERQKKYRAQMKGKKKKEYQKDAAKRAKKSRDKK